MPQTPEDTPLAHNVPPILQLREDWPRLSVEERREALAALPRADSDGLFLTLPRLDQIELLAAMLVGERQHWLRLMMPDDLAELMRELPATLRVEYMALLETVARREVAALLAYSEDEAGGLMNPRFSRVRPDLTVAESIRYMRRQAATAEPTNYIYVLDGSQKLLGVVSLRRLFGSPDEAIVSSIMRANVIAATETMEREDLARLFQNSGLSAIPVLDEQGVMKGILTVDDIVDVVQEEATEDIQRLGGSETLDAPYLRISLPQMIKKRAGWLTALFLSEMLTASAMAYFEKEIERAVVLALFIPLIISSGGNSGSQASTLVVRAIALGEVRLSDWWRVLGRELVVGTVLGFILGSIGMMRIIFWPTRETLYTPHYTLVGLTVAASLLGIVLWGSVSGAMLPFFLKKVKFDPATASAPFVATLVDVFGLVLYFSLASLILRGTLL